jgi:hypothetical protein
LTKSHFSYYIGVPRKTSSANLPDDPSKGVELERKLSDIYTLRRALSRNYPGIYLPKLPPKKEMV